MTKQDGQVKWQSQTVKVAKQNGQSRWTIQISKLTDYLIQMTKPTSQASFSNITSQTLFYTIKFEV